MHYTTYFFFFQAEDGIRDHCVTGVQTCALPICLMRAAVRASTSSRSSEAFTSSPISARVESTSAEISRSEERRVGKECRSWCVVDQYIKRFNEISNFCVQFIV